MTTTTYIYALQDPITEYIRYVGKTINPTKRFRDHLTDKSETFKARWIRSLQAKNQQPTFMILEEVTTNWIEAEIFWIAYLKSIGCPLTNLTTGGEGVPLTEEGRRNLSKAMAKVHSLRTPEEKAAIARSIMANSNSNWVSPANRAKGDATRRRNYISNPKRTYKVTEPDGNIVIIKSLKKYAEDKQISRQCLYKLAVGKLKSYKGYKCSYI